MLHSFSPIIDHQTRCLIIGSMPGVASLTAAEYYAHPRNLFWKFLYQAFDTPFNAPDYPEKCRFIITHQLGLWDSLAACERDGSLDSAIKNECPNDFRALLTRYPNVQHLLFNGQPAFRLFKKYQAALLVQIPFDVLPSTSPANASQSLEIKYQKWREALHNALR